MHVVAPATYAKRPQPKQRKRWPYVVITALLIALVINYLRPLPAVTVDLSLPTLPTPQTPAIQWPGYGQSAIGAPGYDVLATNGAQTPLATASIAKVITALCVLQKMPLTAGQSGPTFTIGDKDVAVYTQYVNEGGSVLNVAAGEQLSEYQALEALLIPSANNIADSLVSWVFGSQSAYVSYATDYLNSHGLTSTHIGSDASGFDASTTSTASDLTLLGQLAQASPVLMTIAGERATTLPVVGTVTNYNTALGVHGINGIKTGNNDANTGALLFSANLQVGDKTVPVDGTVMGAPDLPTAISRASQLVDSMQTGFVQNKIATKGQQAGAIRTAWGKTAPITFSSPVELVRWQATKLYETHELQPSTAKGKIGTYKVANGKASATANLNLAHDIAGPSFWWRLTRH